MLTPVRVRGKNNRDQSRKKQRDEKDLSSALPAPKRRPGRPHNSKRVAAQSVVTGDHHVSEAFTTCSYSLSTLEQLPTELLQTIFLLSRNINLPMSSSYLCSVLTSPHLRTELVIDVFAKRSYSEQHLYAGLQSSLLRQKWLTYDFFQRCQKTYLLRRAILVIRKHIGEAAQDAYRDAVEKITGAFDTYYSLSHRILMKLDPLHYSSGINHPPSPPENSSRHVVFVGTDQKGVKFSIVLDNEGNCMDVFTPWVADPRDNLWPKDHLMVPKNQYTSTVYSMLSAVSLTGCDLPEKLLHGPWTNERGYFLKLLMDANARVDWLESTSGEVALQGFEDAIREENVCAISVLRSSARHLNDCLGDTRIREIRECLEDLKTGKTTIEDLTNPHASWRIPAGHLWFENSTVGVKTSTKHLKIAILEKPINFKVLEALLESEGQTEIDCDDTELENWAMQKKAEDRALPADVVTENIGAWLLDKLEIFRKAEENQP